MLRNEQLVCYSASCIIENIVNQSSHYRLFTITNGDNKKLICFDPISSTDLVVLAIGTILNFNLWAHYKL